MSAGQSHTTLGGSIRYTWKCPQWSEGAAGCHMGGGTYAYEISPNEKAEP